VVIEAMKMQNVTPNYPSQSSRQIYLSRTAADLSTLQSLPGLAAWNVPLAPFVPYTMLPASGQRNAFHQAESCHHFREE
jgi:hypothetical protein